MNYTNLAERRIENQKSQSTYCSGCGQVLIGRDWYTLSAWNLDAAGRCNQCRTPLPGVLEALPGTWGARRQPVRLDR